jgi:YHS domain-containing protein
MVAKTHRVLLDPICGTRLLSEEIWATYTYIGQEYSFCCKECYDLFRRSPEYFIALLAHNDRGNCGIRPPSRKGPTSHPAAEWKGRFADG